MYLVGNKRADIARVIPCKNNFCTKFAHRFHFCGLQKLNTLNLRLFHPPLNPCNHFPTVLIKTNWYTISYKFYGCRSLKEINIPNKVTSIGESAFKDCEALEKIDLSQCDKLKKIEKDTFWACDALKEVKLPDSITVIEDNAFYDCDSLKEINIPNKVTSIGESAFKNCEALGEKTLSQYDNFLKKEARKKEEERRAREESKRIEEKRKKKIII